MSMLTVSMKEELIAKLEDLTKENVSEETFSRADEIKNDYYLRECDRLHQEQQIRLSSLTRRTGCLRTTEGSS